MVPIDSQWVVSYSTSIDPIVVSVTVFEIFECNLNDLELVGSKSSKVRDHCPNQKFVDCFLSDLIVSDFVSRTVFETFDAKILWPCIRTVQVIQGQRSWCQLIARGWFSIRLPLTPSCTVVLLQRCWTYLCTSLVFSHFMHCSHSLQRSRTHRFLASL